MHTLRDEATTRKSMAADGPESHWGGILGRTAGPQTPPAQPSQAVHPALHPHSCTRHQWGRKTSRVGAELGCQCCVCLRHAAQPARCISGPDPTTEGSGHSVASPTGGDKCVITWGGTRALLRLTQ